MLKTPEKANIGVEKEKKYKYDTIITHGGGIRQHEKKGWRSTNYGEGDDFGPLGSRVRFIATEYLYEQGNVAENVLTTTGKPKYLESEPAETLSESEIGKKELVGRGIPKEKIFIENESKNSRQNIEGALKIAKEKGWKKLLVISSEYHMPRLESFYELVRQENPEYSDMEIEFQSAEEILIKRNPKWSNIIKKSYQSPEMEKRIINEAKGLRDLEKNLYRSIQEEK